MRESLAAEAIRETDGAECAACGSPKRRGHAFCPSCFHALPGDLRRALWKTISEGYALAYDEAKQWLRVNAKI